MRSSHSHRPLKGSAVSLAALLCGIGLSAGAQEAPVADKEPMSEVIVTVQKRAQKLIDVPAAVTGLSGSFLTDVGVTDFAELALYVPGFEVQDQSPNNPGFVMRGITSDSGAATAETRVSVYQDGVSISRSRGSYVELFDIERVEVAKGPQSTLFGRGALIGAVNIIQNKAKTAYYDAGAAVSVGDYNYRMVEGMMNVPIGDKFALRVSGRTKHRDGYTENLLGGEDFNGLGTSALRLSARWAPSEALNFDLIINSQRDRTPGTGVKSGTYAPVDPATGVVLGDTRFDTGAALSSAYGFKGGRELGLERTVTGTTLLASYDLSDAVNLSSITAYRRFSSSEIFDADGFALPLFVFAEDARGTQWSQELRLNYDGGGNLSGFIGLGYFDEEGSQSAPLQFDERVAALFLVGALSEPNPQSLPTIQYMLGLPAPFGLGAGAALLKGNHREGFTNFGETRSYDVYGDLTYRFTPKFEVTAGLRYTKDDKTTGYASWLEDYSALAAFVVSAPVGSPFGLFVQSTPNGGRVDKSFTDDGMTWRVIGRYIADDSLNLYLSYARGRQPETVSASAPLTPFANPRFATAEAETVDSVELGLKMRAFEGRLSFDTAIYNYQYDNFQTAVVTGPATIEIRSAGEAQAYGLETQAYYRPKAGVDLFATYAYSHARFGNGFYEGNHFRLSPDHTLSVGARIKAEAMGAVWSFTPTYVWQSEVFFSDDNDLDALQTSPFAVQDRAQDETQDAYGVLNLRVGYAPISAKWSLEAFFDNMTDEAYLKDAGNTGDTFGIPTFVAGEPRTYGLTLRVRY